MHSFYFHYTRFHPVCQEADRIFCAVYSLFCLSLFRRLFLCRFRLRSDNLRLAQVFNAPSGAFLGAETAGLTLIIVDDRISILHDNRLKLANLFALFAADAGILAGLHRRLSRVPGGTAHVHLFLLRAQLDQSVGTDLGALIAGDALFRAERGNAVLMEMTSFSQTETQSPSPRHP